MKTALIQFTAGDDPDANLKTVRAMIRDATGAGAEFVLTPEVSNVLSNSRRHQDVVLHLEVEDPFLKAMQAEAKALGIWLLIGSLAIKTGDADGRFANRSFLITPEGTITARYDKIHMFDVQIDENESYRESAAYRPGDKAIVADTPFGKIGLTICYDMRFPHLYRKLAKAGATIITAPAAFSPVTGAAHWESLLRARAIENGVFILAPAQCGQNGPKRATHGHSLIVSPWGEVLADGGDAPGITMVDLDLADVERSRRRVPSLDHDREFEGP
ncbi:carbon-nitrogen hydrolase family protein [Aliiroseovarius sp. S1339]|uniref:carbon-nitrogen hydrolase family protein n=1 Tax=Aliiroseovarius sp. S1339 TaxID=2936990 RepID=UPI0020C146F0|nr:carbon-nitrogen hydrolase family protein [Aliiroseovarius sp. S1339]MCK8463258.1 carbon-nitrogen hydrolase family protein [Aliiroseovarius sp. S1339]